MRSSTKRRKARQRELFPESRLLRELHQAVFRWWGAIEVWSLGNPLLRPNRDREILHHAAYLTGRCEMQCRNAIGVGVDR